MNFLISQPFYCEIKVYFRESLNKIDFVNAYIQNRLTEYKFYKNKKREKLKSI